LVGEDASALADRAILMLRSDVANEEARRACAVVRTRVKGWAETASRIEGVLIEAARRSPSSA
jgi:hypothetical protein